MLLTNLPNDPLLYLLSFLEISDLNNMSLASKELNELIKKSHIWKDHCLKELENCGPYKENWFARYRTIQNLKTFSCKTTSLRSIDPNEKNKYPLFNFILEDEYYVASTEKIFFLIENLSLKKKHTLDILPKPYSFKNDRICGLDPLKKNIRIYNVKTGELIKSIQIESKIKKLGRNPHLFLQKEEIIFHLGEKIFLQNIADKNKRRVFCDERFKKITNIFCTTNFIICVNGANKYYYNEYSLQFGQCFCVINKHTRAITDWDISAENKNTYISATSDNYLLCINESKLKFYEDIKTELKLVSKIDLNEGKIPLFGKMSFMELYENLLIVIKNSTLSIWNIKTGKKFIETKVKESETSTFCFDGNSLFLTQFLTRRPYFFTPYHITHKIYSFLPQPYTKPQNSNAVVNFIQHFFK